MTALGPVERIILTNGYVSGKHTFFFLLSPLSPSAAGEFFLLFSAKYLCRWFSIIFSEPVKQRLVKNKWADNHSYKGGTSKVKLPNLWPHSGQRKKIVVPSSTLLNWASDQVISFAAHFGQSFLIRAFSVPSSPSSSWTFDVSFVRRTEGNWSMIVVVDCENMVSAKEAERNERASERDLFIFFHCEIFSFLPFEI